MTISEEMKVVLRVKPDMDRRELYATTYQMRNPFHQFADAVATELDAFNYFSLARAADLCPHGGKVLDLCCGRGLLLPFLRYRNRQPAAYVGVDLAIKNATWREGVNRDPRRRGKVEMNDSWVFPRIFVEGSVGEGMSERVRKQLREEEIFRETGGSFELIVFTSAIEHMQPEVQQQALIEAAYLSYAKTRLYLTCPITEEGRSGYDCQYAAHIYEPTEKELEEWLTQAGWRITDRIGLTTKIGKLKKVLSGKDLELAKLISRRGPRAMTLPMIASIFPESATEMAFLCERNPLTARKQPMRISAPRKGVLSYL